MMDSSEIFMRAKYPFINHSAVLMPTIYGQANNYIPVSCLIISRICHAGMQTVDALLTPTTTVSVQQLLNGLWQVFWSGYVSFSQLANISTGTNELGITSEATSLLYTFSQWDEALQSSPFNDVGQSFSTLLQGVTP